MKAVNGTRRIVIQENILKNLSTFTGRRSIQFQKRVLGLEDEVGKGVQEEGLKGVLSDKTHRR